MQLIHTLEAKAFLSHEHASGSTRPLLPVFMANGTRLIAQGRTDAQKRSIAGIFMCKLDACHSKILHRLRPFMFMPCEGLFSGLEPIPAHNNDIPYDKLVMPAVSVLTDYDLLVGLTYLHPGVHRDNTAIRFEAGQLLSKALARIHASEKIIQRGGTYAHP